MWYPSYAATHGNGKLGSIKRMAGGGERDRCKQENLRNISFFRVFSYLTASSCSCDCGLFVFDTQIKPYLSTIYNTVCRLIPFKDWAHNAHSVLFEQS